MVSLIIGGDLVPTKLNNHLFKTGNLTELIGDDIYRIIESSDCSIFNLEGPICRDLKKHKLYKRGPTLRFPIDNLLGLRSLKPSLLNIANNHIFDYGKFGVEETICRLKKLELEYIGVSPNQDQDVKILDLNKYKIGIYSCAENEFSTIVKNGLRVNNYDSMTSYTIVENLRKSCDRVLVLFHGGKELYQYPTIMQQKICRKFIEGGADLIVCQHSHCIGAYEKYLHGQIIYGQGNFLFNKSNSTRIWNEGLLVQWDISFKDNITYIPIVMNETGVRLAEKNRSISILNDFKKRSDEIKEYSIIEELYSKRNSQDGLRLVRQIIGNTIVNKVYKKLTKHERKISVFEKRKVVTFLNLLRCETHRESLIEYLIHEYYFQDEA